MAEVLITLGIIGVVAAITLPTLIKNYQKTVWVNQLKKASSTLSEGFKQMVAREGCTSLECIGICDYTTVTGIDVSKEDVRQRFVNTFKLENVFYNGLPTDSIYNYEVKALSGESDGVFSNFILGNEYGLVGTTPDGMIISFINAIFYGSLVVIDINGIKSPNTVGRDIFFFAAIDYNGNIVVAPWGLHKALPSAPDDIENGCLPSSNVDSGDRYCAAKIVMDGWKMNY